jgi:IS4 transposase
MYSGEVVFAQLMEFLPRHEFNRCVQRYRGNSRVRNFTCRDQFLAMAFAQLTYRESLRDIETCLRALRPKLYHAGFRGNVSRSTLADANERRDWRIYADFAQALIRRARKLYAQDGFGAALEQTAYVLDSSTIDLCMTLFPWAHFRSNKSGVKLHTLLDLRGNIPCFLRITAANTHDTAILDNITPEAGAFYIFDRGYNDYGRLYRFTLASAFFVIRPKGNLNYLRRHAHAVDRSTGVRFDHTIVLANPLTKNKYLLPLRRIRYVDAETGKRLVFLTNHFTLPAILVAQLYKCRWQVELFFKWIKQHLRIKAFYGTSPNAVKTQVWIAISVYVLVAILRKELGIDRSLYEILQILSVSLFEKCPVFEALTAQNTQTQNTRLPNQLKLFDL